jgi:hypothetical protein
MPKIDAIRVKISKGNLIDDDIKSGVRAGESSIAIAHWTKMKGAKSETSLISDLKVTDKRAKKAVK